MPLFSDYARKKKVDWFFSNLPKSLSILEIGCADGWLGSILKAEGFSNYTGIDITPSSPIVGDIREWRKIGLKPQSYDVIVGFEVLEHINFLQEASDLLKPNGSLFITTPMPCMDWVLKILEWLGLNQSRTSPHCNLVYVKRLKLFKAIQYKSPAGLSQWAVLKRIAN